jgi:hypothetical protein
VNSNIAAREPIFDLMNSFEHYAHDELSSRLGECSRVLFSWRDRQSVSMQEAANKLGVEFIAKYGTKQNHRGPLCHPRREARIPSRNRRRLELKASRPVLPAAPRVKAVSPIPVTAAISLIVIRTSPLRVHALTIGSKAMPDCLLHKFQCIMLISQHESADGTRVVRCSSLVLVKRCCDLNIEPI